MNYAPVRRRCSQCGDPIDGDLCESCRSQQNGTFAIAHRRLPRNGLLYIVTLIKSRLFLGLLIFAIVPILLTDFHLNVVDGMMIYFSLFWFFVFQPLMAAQIQMPFGSVLVDIGAYVFTGSAGALFALTVESFWTAHGANRLLDSRYFFLSAPGYILFVGLTEEFAKQIFVLVVLGINRAKHTVWHPLVYMMIGISSGLGFSAIENILYVQHGISFDDLHRGIGLGAMTALSRALYTPFLHAIWAGILAYALGVVAQRGYRDWALALGALILAATLHGVYDASLKAHGGLSILDVALSYLVFLGVLLNHRRGKERSDAA